MTYATSCGLKGYLEPESWLKSLYICRSNNLCRRPLTFVDIEDVLLHICQLIMCQGLLDLIICHHVRMQEPHWTDH